MKLLHPFPAIPLYIRNVFELLFKKTNFINHNYDNAMNTPHATS